MCDANPIMVLNLAACHQIRERKDEQSFDSALSVNRAANQLVRS